jgi:hypothetical protein
MDSQQRLRIRGKLVAVASLEQPPFCAVRYCRVFWEAERRCGLDRSLQPDEINNGVESMLGSHSISQPACWAGANGVEHLQPVKTLQKQQWKWPDSPVHVRVVSGCGEGRRRGWIELLVQLLLPTLSPAPSGLRLSLGALDRIITHVVVFKCFQRLQI